MAETTNNLTPESGIHPVSEKLVTLLKKRKLTISFAESCTGGLLAAGIIDISGASEIISESYITYSIEAKQKILGISEEIFEKYDVVSEEVAIAMAKGLRSVTNADVCISATGNAGTVAEGSIIPSGTVCAGFVIGDKCFAETLHFGNIGRNRVRRLAVEQIYEKAYSFLSEE